MRPLPEPMDGEAARPPRSTDDTARIPVMDDDAIGRHEAAGTWPGVVGPDSTWRRAGQQDPIEPGWYERMRADVAAADTSGPALLKPQDQPWMRQPHYPRHQAPKDDLPGPTRRELARLVRQVRALVIVTLVLVATLPFWVQGLYQLVY